MLHPTPLIAILLTALLACAEAPSTAPTLAAAAPADAPAESDPLADEPGEAADADVEQDDQANEAHRWLERIEARAAEIDTLAARVRYVRVQGLLGDRQIRFGMLRYDAGSPKRFAVDFDRMVVDNQLQDHQRQYIFDGRWLAELQHDRKLFIRRELVPADQAEEQDNHGGHDERDEQVFSLDDGPFVLPFDLEKDKVLERFTLSLIPRETTDDEADDELSNTVHLRLEARPHVDTQQQRLDVWYDRETRLPVRIRGAERGDDHWIIQLMQTETGVEIDPAIFDTTPPAGPDWQVEINPYDARGDG